MEMETEGLTAHEEELRALGQRLTHAEDERDTLLSQVIKFQTLITALVQACHFAGYISHIAANEHAALRCRNQTKAIHWATVNNKIEAQLKTVLAAAEDIGFAPIVKEMPR